MKQVISGHNRKILKGKPVELPCNCRKKDECPLDGQCRAENLIYQATVTQPDHPDKTEHYVGMTAPQFKKRFANHTKSFNHRRYSTETTLSMYIWTLKDSNTPFTVKFKILDRARPYSVATGRCSLCTLEKYYILHHPERATLNRNEEIFKVCRHRNSLLLDKT